MSREWRSHHSEWLCFALALPGTVVFHADFRGDLLPVSCSRFGGRSCLTTLNRRPPTGRAAIRQALPINAQRARRANPGFVEIGASRTTRHLPEAARPNLQQWFQGIHGIHGIHAAPSAVGWQA